MQKKTKGIWGSMAPGTAGSDCKIFYHFISNHYDIY